MPFVKVIKGMQGIRHETTSPIRMGATLSTGAGKPKSLHIYIDDSIIPQLGIELMDANTRCHLALHEGTEQDAGFLMLIPDSSGYAVVASKQRSLTLSMAIAVSKIRHYVLNECPVPVTPVEFSIEDHTILLQCPDWLRYNSLSLQPKQVVRQLNPPGRFIASHRRVKP